MKLSRHVFRWVFLVLLLAALLVPAAPAFALTGSISLSATTGNVGTLVTLTGSGFSNTAPYTVLFVSTDVASGTTSASGAISTTFTVPQYPRGSRNVTVTGPTDTSNTIPFSISPTITPDATAGQVGDRINVSGTGFTAGAAINIFFDGTALSSATTNSLGSFTGATLTIPAATTATHTLSASDDIGATPGVAFNVIPKITSSPLIQTTGSEVTITGSGFAPNSSITFFIDGTAVPAGQSTGSNSTGSFTNSSFPVPALRRGSHVLLAQDASGNSATVNFTIQQSIAINPATGAPGATIQVKGNGFTANAGITIRYNGVNVTTNPATIIADANGAFTASFTVPSGGAGNYTVETNDGSYSATATFRIVANIGLSANSGKVGSDITVSGSGFNPGSTVTIRYDNTQIATATTDANGAFTSTFKAPNSPAGQHLVNASDGTTTLNTVFNLMPSAEFSPASGPVGSPVALSGQGFLGSGTVVILFDGVQVTVASTNATGAFNASFAVPAGRSGEHSIAITDTINAVTVTFNISASGSLNPTTGNVGGNITASGAGFGSNRSITITYDGAQVASATTDARGSFSNTFKAPSSKGGGHAIAISDGVSTVTQSFTVTPSIALNPSSGFVGSDFGITGTGFAAGRPVTLKYDNESLGASATDANGAFSVIVKAPVSRGGGHSITATDGASTVAANFSMDSAPPVAPGLVAPVDNAKADAEATFSWASVADPSGVTYTLQIASDSVFSQVVLTKTGLTSSGYTLTPEERLKSVSQKSPYYWRVKAIDRASNESPWSAAQTFYVGFVLATWALYVIFGVIVILAAFGGYRFGRRLERKSK